MDDSNSNRSLIIAIVIILIVLFGWLLFRAPDETSLPIERNNAGGTTTPIGGTTGTTTNAIRTVVVTAKNFSFSPTTITVNRGDRVIIDLNISEGFHDFVIDEYEVATGQLNAGQNETLEFVADKIGAFEYYCSVGNHKEMGMTGNFIVQ